jgi:biopolymer transport protein ExbD
MKPLEFTSDDGYIGFQIAPMLDVMFVLMLFFMVMAGAVNVERELNSRLPGSAEVSDSVDFPDEQIVSITTAGEIYLNEEAIETSDSKDLTALKGAMSRLKENADSAKTSLLVTIVSEEDTPYRRAIDVLDALAVVRVTSVTFTTTEEEIQP